MFVRRFLNTPGLQVIRSYAKESKEVTIESKPNEAPNEEFTKTGDLGQTRALNGELLEKDHRLFKAIGATEELLSYIGLAREYAVDSEHDYIHKLKRIQTVLIDITTAISKYGEQETRKIQTLHTKELEDWILGYAKQLPPPERYIIPGGGVASASLSVARSICRRTERSVVPLVRDGGLDKETLVYLNRLSDFLFTLSRLATKIDKRTESIYVPQSDEKQQAQ